MTNASGPRKATNATGTLAQTPLSNALVYIRNKRLTGVLELRAPGGREAKIDLWRGMIAHATTTPAVARFGSVVYELGWIDATTLDASGVESLRKQKPQADLLVASGAISMKQRDEAQAEQVRRRVHHAFTFPPETRFDFTEAKPTANEPRLLVDPLAPVWRGILDFPPREAVKHVVAQQGDVPLRLVSEAALERAGLGGEERALCEALADKPMSVGALRALAKVPADRVELLVYLLVIAKCAERDVPRMSGTMTVHDDNGEPPRRRSFKLSAAELPAAGPGGARADALPPPMGPSDLGMAGIRRRAAALASESPYEALGLPEGASVEAARAQYVRLAKLWHPDRLPLELEPVQADVIRIYFHIRDSFRAITGGGEEARAAN